MFQAEKEEEDAAKKAAATAVQTPKPEPLEYGVEGITDQGGIQTSWAEEAVQGQPAAYPAPATTGSAMEDWNAPLAVKVKWNITKAQCTSTYFPTCIHFAFLLQTDDWNASANGNWGSSTTGNW